MPVVVGVIVSLIILISFSGWFYHLVEGWHEYVIDDVYFWYRIAGATVLSFTIMTLTFLTLAYASECPGEKKSGLSEHLNCIAYSKIVISAEDVFKKKEAKETQQFPKANNWEDMTQER